MFAITKLNKEIMYNIMDDIVDTVSSYFDKVLFIIDSRIIYDTGTYRKINFFSNDIHGNDYTIYIPM